MSSISLKNVCVTFPVYDARQRSLKNLLITATTGGRIGSDARRGIYVEALSNINLHLKTGDRVALIGHNGAGKSTLLRLMAGIYEPTSGAIEMRGRVAPILDSSLGVDPEINGYDNIRLRGLFLGLTSREIEERMAEIAEFSELGAFLNMPMRTYSDGMHTRLTFSVSTSIDPEILLLDEGIASGDAAFMIKAYERMERLIEKAGILVLASHSVKLVEQFCNRGVLLQNGRIVADGEVKEVLATYIGGTIEQPNPPEPTLDRAIEAARLLEEIRRLLRSKEPNVVMTVLADLLADVMVSMKDEHRADFLNDFVDAALDLLPGREQRQLHEVKTMESA